MIPRGPPDSTARSKSRPLISTFTPPPTRPRTFSAGNLAVLEDELARVRAAHAQLVELLRRRETREALLDQEGGHAARAGLGIGLGIDDEHVGVGAVRDPHLVAVQHEAVAAPLGAQAHRHDVGPGAGLAHRERTDVLAGHELRQVARLLFRAAVAADLVHAEVRVRAVRQPDGRARAAHLLHRDDVREVAEAGPAVFLVDGHAEQAERAELAPEVHRELVRPVDLGGPRRDLGGRELAHRIAQHPDGLAEGEIEGRKTREDDGCSSIHERTPGRQRVVRERGRV
jgi:hypothetical protein